MANEITSTKVLEEDRMDFMPKHFGNAFMRVENGTYTVLDSICKEYTGGSWDYIELSNGGGYMRLDEDKPEGMEISCSNYYSGFLSPDAASIVAMMYSINKAVHVDPENESLVNQYYFLRDYAIQHDEVVKILGAID